ncbi:MAG: DNA repair protein RecN [Deltaproteobacteria bacterium]|nr:MAG: DNA repair protein RecN [Deltaproteobacteria bacterium]
MLCELRIKNLALIESLHLCFQPKNCEGSLIVMTGETGAGKSIMLKALRLLSGKRASADWVRKGEESCEVEALFEFASDHTKLLARLTESGFGGEEQIVIKRIIGRNGRSRFYINNSIASAKMVSALTDELFDIASQHDQQYLLRTGIHLDLLDTVGENWGQRELFGKKYRLWQQKKAELSSVVQREQQQQQRRDFLSFQVAEIREAAPLPGEDEELIAEKRRLKNAQSLIDLSQASYQLLSGELGDGLRLLRQNITQLSSLDEGAVQLAEEISDYSFLAEDYAQKLRRYQDSLENNPYRLEQVNERLDLLAQLKRKYGETLEQVLQFAEKGEFELEQLEKREKEIAVLRQEVATLRRLLYEIGQELSERRQRTAVALEQAMEKELSSLSFGRCAFIVNFADIPQNQQDALKEAGPAGWDSVEFYFTANPGEEPKPLAKIASGGELSRLLLALKCLLASRDKVETVIFDEVDTGVGGEAAEAVARKVRQLAEHHQVFCITHLPQIAARGGVHLQVVKSVTDNRTRTSVALLDHEQRVSELVRMLAGDSATAQTEIWARDLLRSHCRQKN